MQEFDNLFEYTFQKVPKIKLLNINIVQGKYGIIIDQKDHQSPFPVDTSFENTLFMTTPLIGFTSLNDN